MWSRYAFIDSFVFSIYLLTKTQPWLNSLLSQGLAGIQPVDVPGIENVSFVVFVFH